MTLPSYTYHKSQDILEAHIHYLNDKLYYNDLTYPSYLKQTTHGAFMNYLKVQNKKCYDQMDNHSLNELIRRILNSYRQ